jgi:hypothetical protein
LKGITIIINKNNISNNEDAVIRVEGLSERLVKTKMVISRRRQSKFRIV